MQFWHVIKAKSLDKSTCNALQREGDWSWSTGAESASHGMLWFADTDRVVSWWKKWMNYVMMYDMPIDYLVKLGTNTVSTRVKAYITHYTQCALIGPFFLRGVHATMSIQFLCLRGIYVVFFNWSYIKKYIKHSKNSPKKICLYFFQ